MVGAMAISTRKIRHPFLTQTSRVPLEDYTLYCLLTRLPKKPEWTFGSCFRGEGNSGRFGRAYHRYGIEQDRYKDVSGVKGASDTHQRRQEARGFL
jgi:hypothetical protein